MVFSEFPEFNLDDLTEFNDNNFCGDNFGFDGFNWDSSNVAGQSQPYTGVDVRGDLNNYPDFLTPTTAPISLYPTQEVLPEEGYRSPFYQGASLPSSSSQQPATAPSPPSIHPAASPVPTHSHGPWSLSSDVPTTPAYLSYAQPQDIPNLDDLGFGFPTAAESFTLPAVHPSLPDDPSFEGLWCRYPSSGPFHLGAPPFGLVAGVTPPEISLPPPIASSSGPQRTRQPAREGRRHNPIKSAKKEAESGDDSWDQTLVRFRAEFDTMYTVHNGQPSGGLVPAMALAEINEFVKEDLKRSPLRDTKAGEGKRSRDVEDYLKGLLKVICQGAPTPIPTGGGSIENNKTVASLSRLADELEARLAVVNQQPVLRQPAGPSKPRQKMGGGGTEKKVKKNRSEKERRDGERHHMKRISRLFKAPQQPWSKKDALSLAVLFLLYGPEAFPQDFLEARPTATGL